MMPYGKGLIASTLIQLGTHSAFSAKTAGERKGLLVGLYAGLSVAYKKGFVEQIILAGLPDTVHLDSVPECFDFIYKKYVAVGGQLLVKRIKGNEREDDK